MSTEEDKYQQMLALADAFDGVGEDLRARAGLGGDILRDPAVAESAPLSTTTHARVEEDVRAATTGKAGLLSRSIELDADALVVRATVLTYRWIDELQQAAYATLGSIAGRAIGYLAPEVALGGAIVTAGLIETDALDRDSVTSFLGELATDHPELMDHLATGGGLIESLQLRALLTAGMPPGEQAPAAARAGLRAMGVLPLPTHAAAALRDLAGELAEDASVEEPTEPSPDGVSVATVPAPRGLEGLMAALEEVTATVAVRPVGAGRYIAFLPGPSANVQAGGRLRLVNGDLSSYTSEAARAIESSVPPGAKVMLVGSAAGGGAAAELAADPPEGTFEVEQVVTAGSPAAHVPRVPERVRMLALEDRADPVALLGSLVNASAEHRVTVVFDADAVLGTAESPYVAGARAADSAEHETLRAEIDRIRDLGYLS
ncbi:hypothetical protein [Nocardioides insulae]|uniref:hypothetical protein n=1 Tax=Nocardioides insulae TaxID=394734 RepID=UPI0003F5A100|nr:hypothetical protein [Nocardioides insulae]